MCICWPILNLSSSSWCFQVFCISKALFILYQIVGKNIEHCEGWNKILFKTVYGRIKSVNCVPENCTVIHSYIAYLNFFDWSVFNLFFLFRKKVRFISHSVFSPCSIQTPNHKTFLNRFPHLWVTEEQNCLSLDHHWLFIIQNMTTSLSSGFIHNIVQYIQQSYKFYFG